MATKQRLLLVDADPESLRMLEVSLRKEGFEVLTAASAEDALELLAAREPDVVISETRLPGMDGPALLERVRGGQPGSVPFIFLTSDASPEARMRALSLGVEDYVVRPVYIKELTTRVRIILQRKQRERLESQKAEENRQFSGQIADLGLADLMQSLERTGRSGLIRLRHEDGRQGTAFFRQGTIIDAQVGPLTGVEAVYRLFGWSDGRFDVEFAPVRRMDAIEKPTAALLVEGMRRLDELSKLTAALPPLEAPWHVDYEQLAQHLAEIPDEVNAVLRLFDGKRTAAEVVAECGFGDLDAVAILARLQSLGILRHGEETAQTETSGRRRLASWLGDAAGEGLARRADEGSAPRTTSEYGAVGEAPAGSAEPEAAAAAQSGELGAPTVEQPASGTGRTFILWAGRDEAAAESAPAADAANGSRTDPPLADGVSAPDSPGMTPSPDGGSASRAADTTSRPAWPPAEDPTPAVESLVAASLPDPVEPEPRPPVRREPTLVALEGGRGSRAQTPAELPPAVADYVDEEAPTPVRLSLDGFPEPVRGATRLDADSALRAPVEFPGARVPSYAEPEARVSRLTPGRLSPAPESSADLDADFQDVPSWKSRLAVLLAVLFGGGVAYAVYQAGLLPWKPHTDDVVAVAPAPPPGPPTAAPGRTEPPPAVNAEPAATVPAVSPPAAAVIPRAPAAAAPASAETPPAASPPATAPVTAPPAPPVAAAAPAPVTAAAAPPAAAASAGAAAPTAPAADPWVDLLAKCRQAQHRERSREIVSACAAAVQARPRADEAPELMTSIAGAELERDHHEEAVRWARKAIDRNPRAAEAFVMLGGAQQALDHPAEARAAYERYLQLAPRGSYAAEVRNILERLPR